MRHQIATIFLSLIAAIPNVGIAQEEDELIQMIVESVGHADRNIRGLAVEQVRSQSPGTRATERFAARLSQLDEEAQIGLLSALADRGDAAAKSSVATLLASATSDELKAAAVLALGKLGNEADVSKLIAMLSNQNIASEVRESLVHLQGNGVSQAIVHEVGKSPIPLKVQLIEILTARRALEAIPLLLELAHSDDATIRSAAMGSLGQLASTAHIPNLATAVLKAKPGSERNDAEKSLMFVCNRNPAVGRSKPLLDVMSKLNSHDRTALLPALGRVGGEAAWEEIIAAVASRDLAIHKAGIRAISNWPDASVAEQLIEIARTDPHADHQRTARMALLRVAPLPDGRPDLQKLELLKTAIELAASNDERNFGLKRSSAIRLVETLRFILPFADRAEHTSEVCHAIVELSHDRKLRDTNKVEFHAALDKVISLTNDPVLIERANRYKEGKTWVR